MYGEGSGTRVYLLFINYKNLYVYVCFMCVNKDRTGIEKKNF